MAKKEETETPQTGNPKVLVVHLAIGLDIIGSKTSLHTKGYDIEATSIGIKAKSRVSNRVVIIPYANVRGFELIPESGVTLKNSASARTEQALAESHAILKKQGIKVKPQEVLPVLSEEVQMQMANDARAKARQMAREQAEKQNKE